MKSKKKILDIGCGDCELENGKFVCFDPEDAITCFWATNITKNTDMFDFDKNIDLFVPELANRLAEHGLLGFEAFEEVEENLFGERNSLDEFERKSDFIWIDKDELREVLDRHIYNRFVETFGEMSEFKKLKELYDSINYAKVKNAELFDKIIHAQHVTGYVVDVNISDLRKEFEEKIS